MQAMSYVTDLETPSNLKVKVKKKITIQASGQVESSCL